MSINGQTVRGAPVGIALRQTFRVLAVPLGSLALLIAGLAIWEGLSGVTFVIPSVPHTVSSLVHNLGNSSYLSDLKRTLVDIGISFAIGTVGGALFGVMLGYLPWLRRALEPLIVALNAVPKIILYPLILAIFHVGSTAQIVMGSIHAIFPMLIMVTAAVANMPPIYRRLGRSLQASQWQVLWHITLPAIRKPFLTGMRLAVSLATIGVILAEFFATVTGLGRSLRQAYTFLQYGSLIGTVLLLMVICFFGSFLVWMIERRLPE